MKKRSHRRSRHRRKKPGGNRQTGLLPRSAIALPEAETPKPPEKHPAREPVRIKPPSAAAEPVPSRPPEAPKTAATPERGSGKTAEDPLQRLRKVFETLTD